MTPIPGHYRYDVAPALREIVDCLDINGPIREITVMKGAQIGATVGILENCIGYLIDVVQSSPCMMLTADAQLAALRLQKYIVPMIQQSGLVDRIASSDHLSERKSGKTDKQIEWRGGGWLIPLGAQNVDKLRSFSIQYLLEDEIDVYPEGKDKHGDVCKSAEDRTKAYYANRKILRLSTPLLAGTSRIEREYVKGDQRRFYVPCKRCNAFQYLSFQKQHEATGKKYGLIWEMEDYQTVAQGSTRYVCKECGFEHYNSDKSVIFPDGEWRPTSKSYSNDARSYHISALYSPASMYPWEAIAEDWVACWDVNHARAKDTELLQTFYNNNLGRTFSDYGDSVPFSALSNHRRAAYRMGEVPNKAHAVNYAGGHIQLLTCAVDVHKRDLAVAVMGWAPGRRCYLVDYWRMEGDCEQLDDKTSWLRLSKLIEEKRYTADDGKIYPIALTMVDAGWSNDLVCRFCGEYETGVFPCLGRDFINKNSQIKEFREFTTSLGTRAFSLMVDLFKDRYAGVLKRKWRGDCLQPNDHFNCPINTTDAQLKELTTENKRPKIDKSTGKRYGFEWYRPAHAKNELWDLIMYNAGALNIVAFEICSTQLGLDYVDWFQFFDHIEKTAMYYER